MNNIKIGNKIIGKDHPTFIIAEIGSNFDGDLNRAKLLIDLAKACGADAVKFQSFKAEKIIQGGGFDIKSGFQARWDLSVEQVYKKAEFPREWHKVLFDHASSKGLIWFSAPYDEEALNLLEEIGVELYKIGSGDITWLEMVEKIAKKNKPVILATGASTLSEIDEAIKTIRKTGNDQIILLQCVTNYPSGITSANVNAVPALMETFDCIGGYSDHTPGFIVALGTVALGGRVIEKHFTDDKTRKGPDHPHAMDWKEFKDMVDSIRLLEKSFGSKVKDLYPEENETVILQRRCLRAKEDLKKGHILREEDISILRPAPQGSIYPKYKNLIVGKELKTDLSKGDYLTWKNL